MEPLNYLDLGTIAGLVAVTGFLWRLTHTLNKDMKELSNKISGLGDRVARIEGALFKSIPDLNSPKSK